MSQTIVPEHPAIVFRRYCARLWDDPDSRSVLIGILGVLLVHLLLLFLAPQMLRVDPSQNVLRPHSSQKQFNIVIAPNLFPLKAPPKPKPPLNFVETNPNAPDNAPDKTNNFAARNQQVAQEKPTLDGKSDRPAIEGQKEIKSSQIVDGRLEKPVEVAPAAPEMETPLAETNLQAPKLEQVPMSGIEKIRSDNVNGFGSNIAKFPEATQHAREYVQGMKNVPLIQGATSITPQIDPRHPKPRPQVVKQMQTRPAIFEENKLGTQNIGNIGVSAKFSEYGQYLQKMIEAIQVQWERHLVSSRVGYKAGTSVRVVFGMNREGKVTRVIEVEGNAGEQFNNICPTTIAELAPYGPWSDDMIAMLQEEEVMTFTFYYQ